MKPNFTDLSIAKTLRALRIYKGEKLLAVAHHLNMSECNYSKYESGHIAFTIGLLMKVCAYYQVEISVIFILSEHHLSDEALTSFFVHNQIPDYINTIKHLSDFSGRSAEPTFHVI